MTDLNGFTNSVIIYLNINGFLRFKAKKDKESHTFLNMYVKAQKFDYKRVKSLPKVKYIFFSRKKSQKKLGKKNNYTEISKNPEVGTAGHMYS